MLVTFIKNSDKISRTLKNVTSISEILNKIERYKNDKFSIENIVYKIRGYVVFILPETLKESLSESCKNCKLT